MSLWALGNSLARAGRIDSAVGAYEALARRPRIARYRVYGFLGPLAARGRDRLRAAAYEDSLTLPIPGMNVFDAAIRIYYRAIIAAQLGERDRAVRLLQEALAAGLPMTLDSLHVDPGLHPLRGHPAFDAMVRLDDPKGPVAAP